MRHLSTVVATTAVLAAITSAYALGSSSSGDGGTARPAAAAPRRQIDDTAIHDRTDFLCACMAKADQPHGREPRIIRAALRGLWRD